MSEATEKIITHHSPLHETHLRLGAEMTDFNGWLMPASYGDKLFEYAAVRESGAGLIDLSSRARFHVSGSEAVQFLNGLITNDMKTLEASRWMPAAFPNVHGRLLGSVRVAHLEDGFIIDTEAATHEQVLKTLARFTLAGDFRVEDITNQTALLSVQGKDAAEVVQSTLGEAIVTVPKNSVTRVAWQQKDLILMRATHTAEDGFDLMVSTTDVQAAWDALMNAGARPVGYDALEILRIEAGLPRYGVDMDENTIVTEALEDAVSYTKGCYVGQEIIARIKYRGHVAKKLTGIAFDRLVKVGNDAKIRSVDDREIGRITSTTLSPHLGCTIALGYVKYDYIAPGTEVKVLSAAGELAARGTELPFVRGSWYEPADLATTT